MSDNSRDPLNAISVDIDLVLKALFDHSLEGILVSDKDSRIVMANARTGEIFGYDPQEMLGMDLDELIPGQYKKGHRAQVDAFWQTPGPRKKNSVKRLLGLTRLGEELPLDISLNPIKIDAGTYVIAHIVDQTEKGQIQNSLDDNENLLSALIENAVDGVITISPRGIVGSMNPAAARLFGYDPKEVIGKNISMLMPEPHRSSHDGYLENYHRTGHAKIVGIGREVEGKRKDGSLFPFYLSVSKVETHAGHFYTGIVHDLTEQKAFENELKKYSEELEQRVEARTSALAHAINGLKKEIQERKTIEEALRLSEAETQEALKKERELNELKSRFVSMASHEFRTPLATILSSMNLLEKYQDTEFADRRDKHINRIKSNVKNLTAILNDFLSLSKLEEGRIEVQREAVDIQTLAREVCEDIETQAKDGQTINYQHEGLEERIQLDPKLTQNILINLLSNAVKYSAENTQIQLLSKLSKDKLILKVIDRGMGIPEDEMQHLFERFFRAKNAGNIQGTGLGLSIVKRHVELMNGEIEAKSKLNQGTEFSISFPRKEKANE